MKPSERATCERLVDTFLRAGYALNIADDCDELALGNNSTDRDAVLNEMGSTAKQWLTVHHGTSKQCWGYVYLVFGNEDWVLVNDYTLNLESIVEPVCKWCMEQGDQSIFIALNFRHDFQAANLFPPSVGMERACNFYAWECQRWLGDQGPITLHYWLCDEFGNPFFKGEKTIQQPKGHDEDNDNE